MSNSIEPWMCCDFDETCTLHGNREAYQILGAKIEELLQSGGDTVILSEKAIEVDCLKLRQSIEASHCQASIFLRIAGIVLLLVFLLIIAAILFFAIFGFSQFIQLLSDS